MKMPDKLDMVPDSLRKEIADFVSKNANLLFGILNNADEVPHEIHRTYKEIAKLYRDQANNYHKMFLNLLLAEQMDKAAVVNLFHEMFALIAEQNKALTESTDSIYRNYSSAIEVIGTYLMLVSSEGINLEALEE